MLRSPYTEEQKRHIIERNKRYEEEEDDFLDRLLSYVKNNDIYGLKMLLADPKSDEFHRKVGQIILYTIELNNKEALRELLKWGAYISYRSHTKSMKNILTPLGYAAELRNVPIIRMLIREDVDLSVITPEEWKYAIVKNGDLFGEFTESDFGSAAYASYLLLKEEKSPEKDIESLIGKLSEIVKKRKRKIPFTSNIVRLNLDMFLDYPEVIEFFNIDEKMIFGPVGMVSIAMENNKPEAFGMFLSQIKRPNKIDYTYYTNLKKQIIEKYKEGDEEYAYIFLALDKVPNYIKEEMEEELEIEKREEMNRKIRREF